MELGSGSGPAGEGGCHRGSVLAVMPSERLWGGFGLFGVVSGTCRVETLVKGRDNVSGGCANGGTFAEWSCHGRGHLGDRRGWDRAVERVMGWGEQRDHAKCVMGSSWLAWSLVLSLSGGLWGLRMGSGWMTPPFPLACRVGDATACLLSAVTSSPSDVLCSQPGSGPAGPLPAQLLRQRAGGIRDPQQQIFIRAPHRAPGPARGPLRADHARWQHRGDGAP